MVSLSEIKMEQSTPVGAGWALLGSFCYASYLVLLKRKVDHEDKMSIPMFFGQLLFHIRNSLGFFYHRLVLEFV